MHRQSSAASTAASRASTGVSRLAMMQARFQAQQLADKEEKLINLLEQRQEEAVRRVAYAQHRTDSAASHSATSMSSNNSSNSMTAGVGQRPGRVRQMFQDRRRQQDNVGNSPVGWDKSYPLKPVNGMYKRNNSTVGAASKINKYSGNYGPKRSLSQNRGVSLDRGRYEDNQESGYSSGTMVSRTRSHHQLSNSSGEDSYGPNTKYNTFARGGAVRRIGYDEEDGHEVRKASYTREYIRNLPPRGRPPRAVTASSAPPPHLRDSSPSGRSSFEHSSYSSQSSEKSDPPAFTLLPHPKSRGMVSSRSQNQIYRENSKAKIGLTPSRTEDNLDYRVRVEEENRGVVDSRTFRKSRSPSVGVRSSVSRSPSRSPSRHRSTGRLLNRPRQHANGFNEENNNAYMDYADRVAQEKLASKEKEEEKRRIQVEMRKREQELLDRIKKQQRELESVKQEKTKIERELQRQEVLRDRERRQSEEKKREEEKARERIRKERSRSQQSPIKRQPYLRSRQSSVSHRDEVSDEDDPVRRSTNGLHRRPEEDREPPSRNGRNTINRRPDDEDEEPSYATSPRKSKSKFRTTVNISGKDDSVEISANDRFANGTARRHHQKTPPSPTPSTRSAAPAAAPAARRSLFAAKPRDDLIECSNCGRRFADDRIEKHREICIKTSKKKRKTFDMTKMRVEGTDAESYVRRAKGKNAKKQEQTAKKSDWRKKREEFIATMRAAKAAQRHIAAGGKVSDLPPPPPSDNSDYIQCPHCGRRFNESAADRHIPKCANIKSNKR